MSTGDALACASTTAVTAPEEPEAGDGGVRESHSALSVGPTCRICFRGCLEEALRQPCNCRGSIGLVHASCLEKWVSQRRNPRCDICAFAYQVEERSKSYAELLCDREARGRPMGYLLRAIGLLLCVLFLLPMSCAFIAGLHYSLVSVSLYVFSVGHSMFWFRRPVLFFIEFLKTTVEWKRNSSYLKLVLPAPCVPGAPVSDSACLHQSPSVKEAPQPTASRRLLVFGAVFSLNVVLTLPLAWLGAIEMRKAVPTVLMYYACAFLCLLSVVWISMPIACFV
ncbi:E3 ubiquitin-protein ligase MARCHF2-like [Rhipicephalus sanguineus]|uniref:E3 ubiquitin-protein ligase MARCHF2-like n=1 Tax=Rhipicephalus sanguineus TaxID=34632 RepID=UPI0020C4B7D3|nr:E3 ubiquitin-protein ligase MARCHF2-like [Rhipicephalus sanguineus]